MAVAAQMSAGLLIWCVVLSLFGLNMALIVWFVLRLSAGGIWAMLGFNAVLLGTVWGILQLVA